MVWTIVVFAISLYILRRRSSPDRRSLDARAQKIEGDVDAAEHTRTEAERCSPIPRAAEGGARPVRGDRPARAPDGGVARGRGQGARQEFVAEAAKKAEREIEAATKRALDDIRREVADLTIMATEKVTRKSLTDADQKRLVEEALGELDFSSISGARTDMEELAQVYARSLFEVAREQGKLDVLREQLAQLADALRENRELEVSSSPPTSPRRRSRRRSGSCWTALRGVLNFLGLLIENHRMPVIFHIRRQYERLWDEENKTLPVEILRDRAGSAPTESLGKTIGERAGRKVQLAARVDPDILGGIVIRVGNSILDASIRSRLEQLRRQVASRGEGRPATTNALPPTLKRAKRTPCRSIQMR